MNKIVAQAGVIFNLKWALIVLFTVFIFDEVAVFSPFINAPIKVPVLLYGVVAVAVEIFGLKSYPKYLRTLIFILLAFFGSYGVTVLVNTSSTQVVAANAVDLLFTILIVLGTILHFGKSSDALDELRFLNYIVIVFCLFVGVIGIGMFVLNYADFVMFGETGVNIGFVARSNRLFGLLRNPAYPIMAFGVICGIVQLFLDKSHGRASGKWAGKLKYLIYAEIVVSFTHLSIQNPRGIILALTGSVFVTGFLVMGSGISRISELLKTFLVSALCAALVPFAFVALRAVLPYARFDGGSVPQSFQTLLPSNSPMSSKPRTSISPGKPTVVPRASVVRSPSTKSLERNDTTEQDGLLTGRVEIWKLGIDKFTEKPLFGWGGGLSAYKIVPKGRLDPIPHFHNQYINHLVATGIVGTLLFGLFSVMTGKVLIQRYRRIPDIRSEMAVLMFPVVFMLILGLSEVFIIFRPMTASLFFWIYVSVLLKVTYFAKDGRND